MKLRRTLLATIGLAFAATAAQAEIKVGVVLSATGPAASLGIPERNTVSLLPATIGGEPVRYIVLDDASDTTTAVKNARKLVAEDKVDVLVGSTTSPASLAMIDVAAETQTPMISMAASARIVAPMDDKKRWIFKTPQNDKQMASAIIEHMSANKVKTVSFIGFANAYGEGWHEQFKQLAEGAGIRIVANERFNPADTSVTGQALKLMSAKPDAVFIAGSGTPAALPQKTLRERGYKGPVYQTHGVANNDFLRICGKDCEGTLLPVGPVQMARSLPDSNPVRASALAYVEKYEAANGAGTVSSFGAYAWDAGVLLEAAAPNALKAAKPGTAEFRAALRDALESVKEVAGATGIYSMSADDHLGLDERSRVMIEIRNGTWSLLK
ncbi:ABC transporter substrate-binding protein [Thauera linaloolentis]|uniref:Extracellular ligand-binding receptor n=1 Tax=Thauera linaloolentis (strain DSM 12138 / JCM 21573 / CCUG 41526 / CIP 105981 / IAM 15112 / NBRC 102519 / 47Lol) TaxID=1123367 RepID=N6ZAY0_THAL4|nr:ABC transporter substrate-binding protein [Thauera linaloolentis]ENO89329.1 extracellular ligand-binding receptor [Thauera linaloolentis 47Lol = DSM 12138]MCM8565022.1 ABC transporter substrate-binding protein [Thauera linaloolentis]